MIRYSAETVEALMRRNETLAKQQREEREAWKRERTKLEFVNRRLARSLEQSEAVVGECKERLQSLLNHLRGRLCDVEEQLYRRTKRVCRELDRIERLRVPDEWVQSESHIYFMGQLQECLDRARAILRGQTVHPRPDEEAPEAGPARKNNRRVPPSRLVRPAWAAAPQPRSPPTRPVREPARKPASPPASGVFRDQRPVHDGQPSSYGQPSSFGGGRLWSALLGGGGDERSALPEPVRDFGPSHGAGPAGPLFPESAKVGTRGEEDLEDEERTSPAGATRRGPAHRESAEEGAGALFPDGFVDPRLLTPAVPRPPRSRGTSGTRAGAERETERPAALLAAAGSNGAGGYGSPCSPAVVALQREICALDAEILEIQDRLLRTTLGEVGSGAFRSGDDGSSPPRREHHGHNVQ